MRKHLLIIAATFGLAITAGVASATVGKLPAGDSAERTRACAPVAGAATEVAATTGASASTSLSEGSLYYLRCDSEAYVRWCTSSTCDAAAGDFKMPADTIFPFITKTPNIGNPGGAGPTYFAAKSVSVNGSCWLLECR